MRGANINVAPRMPAILRGVIVSNGLPNNPIIDVRSATSPGSIGSRRVKPIGTCLHSTAGINSLSWLQGGAEQSGAPASADYLIERNGTAYYITGRDKYAYHAGQVAPNVLPMQGDEGLNQLLIGIEFECLNTQAPTYYQYDTAAQIIVSEGLYWYWRWPYVIYGHYGIARPLGRRSDPTLFDYGSLMGRLYVRALAAKIDGLTQ